VDALYGTVHKQWKKFDEQIEVYKEYMEAEVLEDIDLKLE
jgi:hypothetical protein